MLTSKKKIVFLTGTRADFGKIKGLMKIVDDSENFDCHVFVTGMHTLKKYGATYHEVKAHGYRNIFIAPNQTNNAMDMDIILANTIKKFNAYIKKNKPDMIVLHGDRIEPLAGAIVGTMNNILVAHIEGGEISGTIDESIRHAISKLSHLHFVANQEARRRLIQMGEVQNRIFIIGSPDIDIMKFHTLPTLEESKKRYGIFFDEYAIFIYHPIVTEIESLDKDMREITKALKESKRNFVVIYPNNDHGSDIILHHIKKMKNHKSFKIFPSVRFEHFLTLLKNSRFIIGNSSSGIREAEVYGVQTINIGTRQKNRSKNKSIIHVHAEKKAIYDAIKKVRPAKLPTKDNFGTGNSVENFFRIISDKIFWDTKLQKQFLDLKNFS